MSWFKNFIGKTPDNPEEPAHSTGYSDMGGQPMPLSPGKQDMKAAREIIRSAALRTASVFGIPPQWMAYEVVTISDDDKAYFQLQVSLRIWDEQLWAQSSAFESQVLKRIREADVHVARAVRAVLWRVLPDAGCPHKELSGHEAWRAETVKTRAAAYDKLRVTLLLRSPQKAPPTGQPLALSVPSVAPAVVPASATQALASSKAQALPAKVADARPPPASGFGETVPMSNSSFGASEFPASGFPTTRPGDLSDELAPTQPAKL